MTLGPHQTMHYFVRNPDGSPEAAARDIVAILQGEIPDQRTTSAVATECLQTIQKETP